MNLFLEEIDPIAADPTIVPDPIDVITPIIEKETEQQVEAEIVKVEKDLNMGYDVLSNIYSVQALVVSESFNQNTFEFLRTTTNLESIVNSELHWDSTKVTELQQTCMEGIGSALAAVWKWIADKLTYLKNLVGRFATWVKSKFTATEKVAEQEDKKIGEMSKDVGATAEIKTEAPIEVSTDEIERLYEAAMKNTATPQLQSIIQQVTDKAAMKVKEKVEHAAKALQPIKVAYDAQLDKLRSTLDKIRTNITTAAGNAARKAIAAIKWAVIVKNKLKVAFVAKVKASTEKWITTAKQDIERMEALVAYYTQTTLDAGSAAAETAAGVAKDLATPVVQMLVRVYKTIINLLQQRIQAASCLLNIVNAQLRILIINRTKFAKKSDEYERAYAGGV